MANLKHDLQTYRCRHCGELYDAHPVTNERALGGQCWACVYIINLSASAQDHYLNGIEQEMVHEGYDIEGKE